MYVSEIVVTKDNENVTVDNIVGWFLRDVNTNTVDYYPNSKADALIDAGEVDIISRVNGELVIDIKDWFTKIGRKGELELAHKYGSVQDMLDLAYTMSEEEAEAYVAGYPVFVVGPAAKMPIVGMVAPTALVCNRPVVLTKLVSSFTPRKEHQAVNYSELMIPYKVSDTIVKRLIDDGIRPLFNVRMAFVDPFERLKLMGMNSKSLLSQPVVSKIQDKVSYLKSVSEYSMRFHRNFNAKAYLREELGVMYELLPEATKDSVTTKADCDEVIEMCSKFSKDLNK